VVVGGIHIDPIPMQQLAQTVNGVNDTFLYVNYELKIHNQLTMVVATMHSDKIKLTDQIVETLKKHFPIIPKTYYFIKLIPKNQDQVDVYGLNKLLNHAQPISIQVDEED
jgi:hypothetical protein